MTWLTLVGFAAIYAAAAASPGPGVALVMARGLAHGTRHAAAFLGGFVAGDLLWFSAACLGLAALAEAWAEAFLVIRWIGIAWLCLLAWKAWHAPVAEESALPAETDLQACGRPLRLFLGSFSLTLGNPKVMVFFLALLPSVVDVPHLTLDEAVLLALVIVTVLSSVLGAYLLLAARLRRLLRSARARRRVNQASGLTMAGVAAAIALR